MRTLLRLGSIYSIVIGSTIGMTGCSSDTIGVPHPERSFYRLKMDIPAVTLATAESYNTVQLSAVAYRGNGEIIPDVTPTFKASDETLTVNESGLVTALSATTNSYVVARVQYGGVTRTDTTWISIVDTDTPSPLSTFTIQVNPIVSAMETVNIRVTARDAKNTNLASRIPVSFTVSDPVSATVSRLRTLTGNVPERSVTLYAKTSVYGVTKMDSAKVTIEYPLNVYVFTSRQRNSAGETILAFEPSTIYIRAGGSIMFCNLGPGVILNTQTLDVVFAQPEAAHEGPVGYPPGSGNIPSFTPTSFADAIYARTFPTAGTYTFQSNLYGSKGTIIVR